MMWSCTQPAQMGGGQSRQGAMGPQSRVVLGAVHAAAVIAFARGRSRSIFHGLTLSLCVATTVYAHTRRVAPDGSGDAATIQAALRLSAAGDTVLLEPGTYTWTSQAASGHSMVRVPADVVLRGEAGSA